ncbi:hypothetical protein H8356DRAFT_91071 [Neocallimastix lanati (nom. inval.)]|nr:hypothetical protein H8356DRAFT_91071 [Neocallimastix sp. JGI-2020a]
MSDGSDYISIYLNNLDNLNERTSHLCVNILFALRNYKDCSYNKEFSKIEYFNRNKTYCGFKKFIKKTDIFVENENTFQSLLEDNKIILDTYVILYDYKKEQYLKELKQWIRTENIKDYKFYCNFYFEWEISDWNSIDSEIGPHYENNENIWKLCIMENKSRNEDVLIFLINEKSIILNKFIVKSVVTMRNPDDYSIYKSYYSETFMKFKENTNNQIIKNYIKKSDLFITNENSKSIIQNNKVVIGAYIEIFLNNENVIQSKIKDNLFKTLQYNKPTNNSNLLQNQISISTDNDSIDKKFIQSL